MSNIDLKPNDKLSLSIEEAALYSGIGENRLRALINEDLNIDWILRVGGRTRVKRIQFEKWFDSIYDI